MGGLHFSLIFRATLYVEMW